MKHHPTRHLNFRQVETFKTVFECGSMTLAAERLGVTQPAVSKLVATLERRVGFALFERRSGRLLPTSEGQLLYEDVERALIGLESLADKAEDIRECRYGRLAIGAMPALSLGLMQGVISTLVAGHPDVSISMQTRTTPQLSTMISARQLDVAVLAHLGRNPLVHVESLHRIPMVCVLPAEHELAGRDVIEALDIADETLVSLSVIDQIRPRIEMTLLNAGIRPRSRIETSNSAAACAFTANGLGVALVDPFSAAVYAGSGIVMRPFEPLIEIEIAVVRPEEMKPSPSSIARRFIDLLGDALHSHAVMAHQVPTSHSAIASTTSGARSNP